MAIWAVGDVHGCLEKLRRLWDALSPSVADEIIFLGDLIDRGPDSKGVLEFVLGKVASGYKITCLMGNHEQMCLEWHRGSNESGYGKYWLINGGAEAIRNYSTSTSDPLSPKDAAVSSEHLDFLETFIPWKKIDNVIFVHAGLRPGVRLEEQKPEDLYWIRENVFKKPNKFNFTVIYGHTPHYEVEVQRNLIGIDTGAVYGELSARFGKLTAYEPFKNKIVQVR